MKRFLLTVLTVAGFAFPAFAQQAVHVKDAFAFATAASQKNGAVFLKIENTGAADKVIAISTPAAAKAELHETMDHDGKTMMQKIEAIDVPANGHVELSATGQHIMLLDLAAPLKLGDTFPLTITFEKAGTVETSVIVTPPGVADPNASAHEHHH